MKCHKELTAVVATRTAAGRWGQAEALADFKRNPFLFTKNVDGWPIAQAMKLVA